MSERAIMVAIVILAGLTIGFVAWVEAGSVPALIICYIAGWALAQRDLEKLNK